MRQYRLVEGFSNKSVCLARVQALCSNPSATKTTNEAAQIQRYGGHTAIGKTIGSGFKFCTSCDFGQVYQHSQPWFPHPFIQTQTFGMISWKLFFKSNILINFDKCVHLCITTTIKGQKMSLAPKFPWAFCPLVNPYLSLLALGNH